MQVTSDQESFLQQGFYCIKILKVKLPYVTQI